MSRRQEGTRDRDRDTAQTFLADVQAEFAFVTELGFGLVLAEQLPLSSFPHRRLSIAEHNTPLGECVVAITYASQLVELTITHDPRGEISATFRERSSPAPTGVDLFFVMRVAAPSAGIVVPTIYSRSTTSPREIVAQLSALTATYAGPWLNGDHAAFSRAAAASIYRPANT